MAEGRRGSSSSRRKLGWEDYLALPEDRNRYEILDGKLAVTASPYVQHQRVSRNLARALMEYVDQTGCGELLAAPVDVVLDAHTIVVPDLLFVAKGRESIVHEHAILGPPDLLVEILSPSTARRDRTVKLRLYARFGVACYWIVDPAARELFAFELAGDSAYAPARVLRGDARETLPVPRGFEIDLSRIWA